MCPIIDRFIEYVRNEMPRISKEAAEKDVQQQFEMTNDESVFYNNHFAVRFSYSKNGSFSNTVLALSKLQKYDHLPFHWAGRATRGVAQFNGNALSDILRSDSFEHTIDEEQSKAFLQTLLDR